jgi:hypothetical protein
MRLQLATRENFLGHILYSVLLIRDVYPGSDFFPSRIPDPGSELFPSRIPDFNPKKWFLSSMKYDPGCSSRIRILTFYPSRIPDPGVKKAPDPETGSATLPVFFGSGLCPIGVGK